MQRYTVYFIWKLLYMFRVVPTPIIRSANVSTASGICHNVTATCRYRGKVGTQFQLFHDDGWWYHPKHVEQFPDKINCVTLHLVGHILE